jgi:hypothetical protein
MSNAPAVITMPVAEYDRITRKVAPAKSPMLQVKLEALFAFPNPERIQIIKHVKNSASSFL